MDRKIQLLSRIAQLNADAQMMHVALRNMRRYRDRLKSAWLDAASNVTEQESHLKQKLSEKDHAERMLFEHLKPQLPPTAEPTIAEMLDSIYGEGTAAMLEKLKMEVE